MVYLRSEIKRSNEFTKFINRYTAKATIKEKKLIEVGTKIATEAIDNIRTVASLSKYT